MNRTGSLGDLARALVALSALVVAVVAGWYVFLEYPDSLLELVGILLVIAVAPGALRLGGRLAENAIPSFTVAEVAVEGMITRDGGGSSPLTTPVGVGADAIVEQIERADESSGADALLVKLNTPGGEIVPSADITDAVADFDGPTVGYATDVCASGGYEIATACDELWAREGSLVGSIGVIGSRMTAAGLAEKLGLTYEQFTAGEFKDAGTPLREMGEDERAYLQGLVDDHYDQFVEDVVEGRDLDEAAVRDTEARVYLGEEAHELGLVDELGTREDVLDALEERLGTPAVTREFAPSQGLAARFRGGAQSVAHALGAGIASHLDADADGLGFDLRR